MSLSLIKYPQSGGDSEPLRFGVAGEDDLAAENRSFIIDDYQFEIQNTGGSGLYTQFRQDLLSGASEIFMQTANPVVNDGAYSYIDVGTNASGQPFIDLYTERGVDDDVELLIEPGNMYMFFNTNSTWTLDGIQQDDTAIQVLALDNSGNVKFVDKTTIGGAGIIAYKTTGDVRGTFDSTYYDISSLTYALDINEHVVFEVWIDVLANGLDSKLQIVAPAGANYVAHYTATNVTTGGVIADYQALGMNPSLLTTQFDDKTTSIILPTGPRYQVRIVGTVINGGTAGNFKFQHGANTVGAGSSIVYAAGFMRTTTIA